MSKKRQISERKRTNILSYDLRNTSFKGSYHPVKLENPAYILSAVRLSMPIEHYNLFLESIYRFPSDFEITGSKKKKPQDLFRNLLQFITFDAEFFWAKGVLNRNLSSIKVFLKLKETYSFHLIFGRYVEAEKILDEVESVFGFSLWLIKNRIALYQIWRGLEEQKKYSNNLKSKLRGGSITRFLVHWISIRNESTTSVGRFRSQTEQILSKLNSEKQKGFKELLDYHLFGDNLYSTEDLIQVVRLSYSASIIDYYESFVSLLKNMILESNVVNRSKALGFISGDSKNIGDERLHNLALFSGINLGDNYLDEASVDAYDDILKGKFEDAFRISQIELSRENNLAINIILNSYAKVFIAEGIDNTAIENDKKEELTLIETSISSLSRVLQKGLSYASNEFNELNKIAINFSGFSWSTSIKLVLGREMSLLQTQSKGLLGEILNIKTLHPFLLDYIEATSLSELYSQICESHYGSRISIDYHKALRELVEIKSDDLFSGFMFYGNGLISFHKNELDSAINYSEGLNSLKINFFVRRSFGIMSHAFLKMGNYKDACKLVADIYVKEKSYYPFLPLQELSSIIVPGTMIWKDCNSLIELSILFDACVKHINKSTETSRRFAYEDYLISIGINKPSEIDQKIREGDVEKVVYYLRYICIESTMDTSLAFAGGSNEVIEERLKVCRLLVELDPKNEIVYKQEIKELVRRQVIASRRQEVDQSRVYVDVASIKDWAEAELEESYYRYITYLKTGLDSKNIVSKIITPSVIDVPDDEVKELLTIMIEEIRSSYLSSDIGLDRFISTRIRHGELERTMRIPIQKHNLITKKEVKTGPYLPNKYWLERIDGNTDSLGQVNLAFQKFSEDYDNLIAKIANEWLQIKGKDKPNGLFDLSFGTPDILRIASSIDASTTLSEFIDLVIKYLDSGLILILVNIREVLNSRGKDEAKALLNQLYETISQNSQVSNIELTRAITQARTDLAAQLDKIIEWFVPSTEGSSAPYVIEDAIMVAEAIIKEATPSFTVEILRNEGEEYSIHGQLPTFIDIFINCFENVIKRSGLLAPSAQIELHYKDIDEMHFSINMKISNGLGPNIDLEKTTEILREIKQRLVQNSYSKYVATEQNSGLIKIYKSINDFSVIDAELKSSMDFGIYESVFVMNIKVPFKIFRLETNENPNVFQS